MSPLETRARLFLWGICPAYAVYFAIQAVQPAWLASPVVRIACLAAATLVHAGVYLVGLLVLRRRERSEDLFSDERDRIIEAHATRFAYYTLMTGAVIAGVMMPFNRAGWQIVNAALFAIVVAEVLRNVLIVRGYRGKLSLAR